MGIITRGKGPSFERLSESFNFSNNPTKKKRKKKIPRRSGPGDTLGNKEVDCTSRGGDRLTFSPQEAGDAQGFCGPFALNT